MSRQLSETNMLLHGEAPSQTRLHVALTGTVALCAMVAAWTAFAPQSNATQAYARVLPSTNTAAVRAVNTPLSAARPISAASANAIPLAAQQRPEFQGSLPYAAVPQTSSMPQGLQFLVGALAALGSVLGFIALRQRQTIAAQPAPLTHVAMAATAGEKKNSLMQHILQQTESKRRDMTLGTTMTDRIASLEKNSIALRGTKVRKDYGQKNGKFLKKLDEVFPGSMTEMEFLAKSTKVLNSFGFNQDNSIPMTCLCRDELTRDLIDELEQLWGLSFNMGSIAGMAYMGKTGMFAGMAHSPQCGAGVERYIFISAPHIAIDKDGNIGGILREGREGISGACGALMALRGELASGGLNVKLDTLDLEQTMMKQQMTAMLKYGEVPTLEDLTKAAQRLIKQQIETVLAEFDLTNTEFAFISGIQIHGPDALNFFQITDFYVKSLNGEVSVVDLPTVAKTDASDILEQAAASDLARAIFYAQQGDLDQVKRWVQLGNDVNAQDREGRACLSTAARFGHADVVKYLLEQGADPLLKCFNGRMAIQEAVRAAHDECAQLLYDKGSVLPYEGAAFKLWRGAREGNLNLAKRAVKYGPKDVVNTKNAEGDSPLFAAVRNNNMDVARFLIAMGAETSGADPDGNTISALAERRGAGDLLKEAEKLKSMKDELSVIVKDKDNKEPLFPDDD